MGCGLLKAAARKKENMQSISRRLCLVLVLAGLGCGNFSGGGSTHNPPRAIVAGKPTLLRLELVATGTLSGPLDARYTGLTLSYRTDDGAFAGSVAGKPNHVTNQQMTVDFELPAIENADSGSVTYWFTFSFDGVPNRREGGKVPIELPGNAPEKGNDLPEKKVD
jgi:hypothetical protein